MKTSYFSISMPLVKENLRRFWALPLVAFMAYFICGILPILLSYTNLKGRASFIHSLLNNTYPVYWMICVIVPVVASVLVYKYLHKSSTVTATHALPFTRASLFNSNLLSGLILIIAPVILIGIILLCIAKPVMSSDEYIPLMSSTSAIIGSAEKINVFTHMAVLGWLAQHIMLVLSVYAVSIFAGSITGSRIIHFFTAIWFNFLAVSLYLMLISYFEAFLYGYTTSSTDFSMYLSPFTGLVSDSSAFCLLAYLVSDLGLIALSSFLYHKRKLERAGMSFVFRFAIPIIASLLAFYGMTGTAMIFYAIYGTYLSIFAALLTSGIVSFILAQMIVRKTFKVFDLSFLKSFGIYALITILFISTLTFDLTGYETRVPKAADVKGVAIDQFDFLDVTEEEDMENGGFVCREKSNIEAAIGFHKEIIGNDPASEGISLFAGEFEAEGDYAELDYTFTSGGSLARSYWDLESDTVEKSPYLKTIYESEECKDYYSPKNYPFSGKTKVSLSSSFTMDNEVTIKKSEQEELFNCLDTDFRARTFEQEFSSSYEIGYVSAWDSSDKDAEDEEMDGSYISILSTDVNTIAWLKAHGYYDQIVISPDDVAYIAVTTEEKFYETKIFDTIFKGDKTALPDSVIIVEDKKQIEEILSSSNDEGEDYVCAINLKPSSPLAGSEATVYFDKNDLPTFLKGKVK